MSEELEKPSSEVLSYLEEKFGKAGEPQKKEDEGSSSKDSELKPEEIEGYLDKKFNK